jgi:hypothetical protein
MLVRLRLPHHFAIRAIAACFFALAFSAGAFSQSISCPVTGTTTLAPEGGSTELNLPGASCVVDTTATLNVPSNISLNNQYQATSSGFTFNNSTIINDGRIVNGGYINVNPVVGSDSAGTGTVLNFGTLINNNVIGVGGFGTVTNAGTLTNFGTLEGVTLNNTATLTNGGGGLIFYGAGVINGTFQQTGQGPITNYAGATFNNAGTFAIFSYGIGFNSNAFNSGTFNNYAALIDSSIFTNNAGGTLINEVGGTLTVNPFVVVNSSYTLGGTFIDQAGSTVVNNGSFQNSNIVTISGVLTNSGTLTNTSLSTCSNCTDSVGLLTITSGGVLNNLAGSSFVQTAGQTIVDGTINSVPAVQLQGGFLQGTGTINGNVNNVAGAVSPGDPPAPIPYSFNAPALPNPGTLTINGNYTQGAAGTLDIGLGGGGAGDFSVLDLSGLATLDGTVEFFAVNGFKPVGGDDFTFLDFGSISGSFAGFDPIGWNCPTGDTCDLVYGADSVSLDILGPSGNGGTSTPEPSSLLLLSAALLALLACSRAKRVSTSA